MILFFSVEWKRNSVSVSFWNATIIFFPIAVNSIEKFLIELVVLPFLIIHNISSHIQIELLSGYINQELYIRITMFNETNMINLYVRMYGKFTLKKYWIWREENCYIISIGKLLTNGIEISFIFNVRRNWIIPDIDLNK